MWRNIKVECKRFRIKRSDNFAILNLYRHIHKNHRLTTLGKLPGKAAIIDGLLECLPVAFIGDGIGIMEPNANSIVNEAFEILEASLEEGK